MLANRLIRWSGLVLILVGVLLLLLGIFPSLLLPTDKPMLDWVLDNEWPLLSVLAFVLSVLIPLALLGLYARQVNEAGLLGLIGFVIVFIDSFFYAGIQFDMAFVWPSLAIHAPALINFSGPMFTHPLFSIAHDVMIHLNPLGFIMFGIAMIRAGVFPKWSAILFTIGMLLASGILFPPFILRTIGGVLASVSLVWMGYVLFSEKA